MIWVGIPLLFVGCTATGPRIDVDPDTDLSHLRTYRIAHERTKAIDPLDRQRIEKAIAGNLNAKGYRYSSQADFVARYAVKIVRDVPSNISFGLGIGSGSWRHGGVSVGTRITPRYDKVRLKIELFDTETHKTFWSGVEEEDLPRLTTPRSHERFWNALVYRLLRHFPANNEP